MPRSLNLNSRVDLIIDLGIDVDTFDSFFLDYLKPDGTTGFWPGSAIAGTQTMLVEVAEDDIDQQGSWQFQAYVENIDGGFHGDPVNLFVQSTIREAGHPHV